MERMIETTSNARECHQWNADPTAFYDALPDEMVQEEAAWGQVGAAGLAALTESDADETHSSSAFTSDNVRS
jgi:hypothetical protein